MTGKEDNDNGEEDAGQGYFLLLTQTPGQAIDIATETNMSYVEHQKGFDFKRKHYGEGSCQLFKKDETFLQIFLVVAID